MSQQLPGTRWRLVLYGIAVLVIAGCATQTGTVSLPVDPPESFSEAGTLAVSGRWWRSFDSERLNAAVDSAMSRNFSLKSARQRLLAAEAVVDRESSVLFPDLEASVRGDVSRTSGQNGGDDSDRNIGLGLSSVYELDLWGRLRSAVDAERFRARATLADYQTAALSLSAETVLAWYRLAEAQSQLNLVEEQIETNTTVLDLLENRFGTGQIRAVDILRQRQLVEATREQRSFAESRIQVLEHRLALLLGGVPRGGALEDMTGPERLPELPPLPETGVPVELVERRPDVRSAFNRLRAADRDLASAISSRYPRLTFSASASTAATDAGSLFEEWALSFAGNLVAPLIYGGRLSAEVERSRAVKQQRLYEYGQAVLVAFREVEDALILEQKQRESIRSLEEQIELARQAFEQLRVEYFNGTGNYLDVLTALEEVQRLRRDLQTARLTLIEYRVALYRALAGTFETPAESGNDL